jgi:hypothetical protein
VAWGTVATTDTAAITRWWAEQYPGASIGVSCGPSGLVVVDLDGEAGMRSWGRLAAEHGDAPTASVSTGRDGGGLHLWYRAPEGRPVRNSAGRVAPGIDVRGVGGMVLAPPSRHRAGRRYRWHDRLPLATLPGWLHALAAPPPPPRRPPPAARCGGNRVLVGLVDVVLRAEPGTRNSRLFWAAAKAAGHAATGLLDAVDAADALLSAAERIGLPATESARTIKSAFGAGVGSML